MVTARRLLRFPEALKECLGDTRAIPRGPFYWRGNQGKTSCGGFNVVGLASHSSSQAFFLHTFPITVETAPETARKAGPKHYGTGSCHKYRARMG